MDKKVLFNTDRQMTLNCGLDLESVYFSYILHIVSLRRTFDKSLMNIFQRLREIWSGQESVTDGQTDGHTKGIPISPSPAPAC